METLKTTVHPYRFNVEDEADRLAYAKLRAELKQTHDLFNVLDMGPGKRHEFTEGQTLELETACIFSNQWNTAPDETSETGRRVFDWYQGIVPNRKLKIGYWLEITPEMREIRRNTLQCGYCGKYYPAATGHTFCEACLDSPYLKESELHLLRLKNCEQHWPKREPLTEREAERLTPLYVERQTVGETSRAVQRRKATRRRVEEKHTKEAEAVEDEYNGMVWLLDRNIETENVIFYSHTGRFCFGWRNPLGDKVRSKLLDVLCEFPFDYDLK